MKKYGRIFKRKMNPYYSPLRYPGGKGKLADYVKRIIEVNELTGGYYVEPYAGGASVALSLLFNEYVSNIIINDIDVSVYAFWHSVLYNTEELCKLISDTQVTAQEWASQKAIQDRKDSSNLLSLGFSTFFLNRTNRSGIISAGMIGGKNQDGKWKIDARFNKTELIQRIKKIALYKNRISLFNYDACQLVNIIGAYLPTQTLIYFDPPYFVKGQALYTNFYKSKDHYEVSRLIQEITKFSWVVSYDYHETIQQLYADSPKIDYSLAYSAGKIGKGKEIMIFKPGMVIPAIPTMPRIYA